ncbi:TetR/AcrR family transcriptional regulator [Thalassotalea agarivorans]|uniref:Transcriptional regulator, TetR family n=1 Tax=Thalassotalea agarivorans TaxID=349064 RepID=A0A1H9Y4E0_THASX|nr:TetR/AcrR family transcriptional regulator [Thalassotalea agarivorans]SES63549.1 transcriptional regulator, TetR family [Thalassotalea agarivorans]
MSPAPKYSHQQQEQIVLKAAETIIEQTSLLDFTMSAIAKEAGISMGSVYKHVQSKEDVLIALATRMFKQRQSVFAVINEMALTTPQKMIALSLLDFSKVAIYSFEPELENFVNSKAVLKRSSNYWAEQMISANKVCEATFVNMLNSAVESGELDADNKLCEQLNLACWSIAVGYFSTVQVHLTWYQERETGVPTKQKPLSADDTYIQAMTRLLNSYPFNKPLDDQSIAAVCDALSGLGYR